MHLKSLKLKIEKLGYNHISVADTCNNLALVYNAQGKFNYAKKLYLISLKINTDKLGSNHTSVADIYNNLANIFEAQGKLN